MSQETPDPGLPPAGWYPDPAGAPALRWWNGLTWSDSTHALTDGTADPAAPTSPPAPPDPAAPWSSPTPVVPAAAVGTEAAPGPRHRGWVVATALVLAVLLLGTALLWVPQLLGGGRRLDTDAIAAQIADSLSAQAGQQVSVSCPGSVSLEAGATFTCMATEADGSSQTVVVTQDDDQGNVTWSLAR